MKKNIFTLITLVSLLSCANYTLSMQNQDDQIREPIPQRVDQLFAGNQTGLRPESFDIIYQALNQTGNPRAKLEQVTRMGFDISKIMAVKEYCDNQENYNLSEDIKNEIAEKYVLQQSQEEWNRQQEIKKNNKIMLKKVIEQDIDTKGWLEIEAELLDSDWEKEDIQEVEVIYQERQLNLIKKIIQDNLEEKNWAQLNQELLQNKFKQELIARCKQEKQNEIRDAEIEKIIALIIKNLNDHSFEQIRLELVKLGFEKNLIEAIETKETQIDIIRNFLDAGNRGGKTDQTLCNELLKKGLNREAVLQVFQEEANKKEAWLDRLDDPKNKEIQKKKTSPKKQKTTSEKNQMPKKVNPKLGNTIKRQKLHIPAGKKTVNAPSNLPANNGGDNGKLNENFLSNLYSFIRSKKAKTVALWTLATTATSIVVMSIYTFLRG